MGESRESGPGPKMTRVTKIRGKKWLSSQRIHSSPTLSRLLSFHLSLHICAPCLSWGLLFSLVYSEPPA